MRFFNRVIDTNKRLAELLPRIRAAEWVAVDTEADSLHAYPEKLCLLQIGLTDSNELIDTLAALDFAPLLHELAHHELILHGADYDLRLLHRTFAFVPTSIFDTVWAARLIGVREFGLVHLVKQLLGVVLEKGPQKADWARRPLSERMEKYARNDTHYLKPLADALRAELIARGRLEWHREACDRLIKDSTRVEPPDPDNDWRVKGCDRLDRLGLALVRELYHWREREATGANKPPYFILSHEALIAVSAAAATSRSVPPNIPVHVRGSRRQRLVSAIEHALASPSGQHPSPRRSRSTRLTMREQARVEELRKHRDHKAAQLGIDPTLIASRATLVALGRNWEAHEKELMHWQKAVLTEK